ncbi:MAG: efflux RND transporter periplasmic adaptor subunit [Rubripirellula sp.]
MSRRDPNTLDLNQQKLRIAADVLVWPVQERGESVYRLEIPKTHRFFRVGYEEYVFISLLDGETTLPQACGLAAAKLGQRAPSATQASSIARWLLKNKIAVLETDPEPSRSLVAESNKATSSLLGKTLQRINPFWIKVPLPQSSRWTDVFAKGFQPLFAPGLLIVGLVLMLVAAVSLVFHWNQFVTSSVSIFDRSNWIWLLVSWIGLKVIHELGHAAACGRVGGSVRESGLVFVLFAPMAYVDVTSCWRMNSRWSRIAVAAAGMYIELLIASLAVIGWMLVDSPHAKFLLHNTIFAAGLSTLLFNANVLMRFDGYFILADLIEVPNLYAEASASVRNVLKVWITGERAAPRNLMGWRRHVVLAYGFAALAWRFLICVSLAIAASTLFAGAGIVIAALGIVIWLGQPLIKATRFTADLRNRDPLRFVRAMVASALLASASLAAIFWIPIPSSVAAPAIVQYLPETFVRSRCNGFITRVHVRDGDRVNEGDLLVELENQELTNRLEQLRITRKQNDIRLRKATEQHATSEQLILKENQKAVLSQIEQLREHSSGLQLRAPRTGTVVSRSLANRVGMYVNEGEPVLIVADETDKQIVSAIEERKINVVRAVIGEEIQVRTASFRRVRGKLDRVEPRASHDLPNPVLAATEGGSMPVRVGDSDAGNPELLEPHFRARIDLASNVAANLQAGMRVEAAFGYQSKSLADRIRQKVRDLWKSAQEGTEASSSSGP